MEKETEFKRLEKYVERLLENFLGMKAENKRLEQELSALRGERESLKERVDRLEMEKGEVSSRVGSLIEKIERWETELVVESEDEPITDTAGDAPSGQSGDRTTVENGEGEEGEEKGGGVQTSLFTSEKSIG